MTLPDERGVLYIGTGARHFTEALRSARSLRGHMPDVPIALMTDQPDVPDVFDMVINVQPGPYPFADKIRFLEQTPFMHTLFLDSDTLVCAPLDDLFTLLERFDLAIAFDYKHMDWTLPGVPQSFPEPNSGVIAYRQSCRMTAFFAAWAQEYGTMLAQATPEDGIGDQTAMRRPLYESDLRLMILPQQYHTRYLTMGVLVGKAHIVHGRHLDQFHDIASVAHTLNRTTAPRVFVGGQVYEHRRSSLFVGGRRVVHIGRYSWRLWRTSWWHLRTKLQTLGWRGTLSFILKRFRRLRIEQRANRRHGTH
jgi:hypothetical protein